MANQTPIKLFERALRKILADYGNEVSSLMAEAVPRAANRAKTTLRKTSPRRRSGKKHYADGWRVKTEPGRLWTIALVYNALKPQLAHLLEYGHATRGGGRTAPIIHIRPVAEEVARTFEEEVRAKL